MIHALFPFDTDFRLIKEASVLKTEDNFPVLISGSWFRYKQILVDFAIRCSRNQCFPSTSKTGFGRKIINHLNK